MPPVRKIVLYVNLLYARENRSSGTFIGSFSSSKNFGMPEIFINLYTVTSQPHSKINISLSNCTVLALINIKALSEGASCLNQVGSLLNDTS